jgi:hypothetical protein
MQRLLAPPLRHTECACYIGRGLERPIAATDRAIDRLVYELYGLSEEEIALVEGATK